MVEAIQQVDMSKCAVDSDSDKLSRDEEGRRRRRRNGTGEVGRMLYGQ